MIAERVATYLAESKGIAPDALEVDTPLLQSGFVDSLGMEDLVVFLTGAFNVAIDDEDMIPDNFETVAAITAFVERKLADRGA